MARKHQQKKTPTKAPADPGGYSARGGGDAGLSSVGFGRAHPHRLDVRELLDPVLGQLAPVARALHAAERQARVRGDHPVDEHEARLDLLGELLASLDVGGPDGRAEAEVGVVGDAQRLVGVADPDHRRDRAERLLVVDGHARPHVGEHRRLEEVAVAAGSACRPPAARAPSRTDSLTWRSSSSTRSARASGPTWLPRSIGSPTLSAATALAKRSSNSSATDSSTMNRLAAMQLWPLFWLRARHATVAAVVEVGVLEHDERVRAAELEHRLLQRLARGRRHGRAGGLRAGERHAGDAVVGDEPLAPPPSR